MRRNAEAIEFESKKRGGSFFAGGHDASDGLGIRAAILVNRFQQAIGFARERRNHGDHVILPPDPAIDFVNCQGQVGTRLQDGASELEDDYFARHGFNLLLLFGQRNRSQSVLQIGDDVGWIFQADRKPYQAIGDAGAFANLSRNISVGHGYGMSDERLGGAEVFGEDAQPHGVHQLNSGVDSAL